MAILPNIAQAREAKYKTTWTETVSGFRDLMRALCVLAASAVLLAARDRAAAASCGDYAAAAARAIKSRVEAVRLIEREAGDRLIGLDTRPFPYLAAQARAAAAAIGEGKALREEDELSRCPDPVPHVRRICAMATLALASAIEEHEAGRASTVSKQAFAEAMALCEGHMGLAPARSRFRTLD
jgi:hypothetical protein